MVTLMDSIQMDVTGLPHTVIMQVSGLVWNSVSRECPGPKGRLKCFPQQNHPPKWTVEKKEG